MEKCVAGLNVTFVQCGRTVQSCTAGSKIRTPSLVLELFLFKGYGVVGASLHPGTLFTLAPIGVEGLGIFRDQPPSPNQGPRQ